MIFSRIILPLLPLLASATPEFSESDSFAANTTGLDVVRSDDVPTIDELREMFPDKIIEDNFDGTLQVRDRGISDKPSAAHIAKSFAIRGTAGVIGVTGVYLSLLGTGMISTTIDTCTRSDDSTLDGQVNARECNAYLIGVAMAHLLGFGAGAYGGSSTFALLWNKAAELAGVPPPTGGSGGSSGGAGGNEESGSRQTQKRDWIGSSSLLASRDPKTCNRIKTVDLGYKYRTGAIGVTAKEYCSKYPAGQSPTNEIVSIVRQMVPELKQYNAGAEFVLHHLPSQKRLGTFQIKAVKDSKPKLSSICPSKFIGNVAGVCPK